jgi:hypothetical protein
MKICFLRDYNINLSLTYVIMVTLHYSVAHYYDIPSHRKKNKYANIKSHISQFLKIDNPDKEFILVTAVDAPSGHAYYGDVEKHLYEFCKKLIPNNSVHVIVKYNWGGTIAALWHTYLLLENSPKDGYIAHFEEDFGPKNPEWYAEATKLLGSDIICVGESSIGRIKSNNDDGRLTSALHKNQVRLGNPEVWIDGGFYFSNIEKLTGIKKKIGIFHKGDPSKKYDNLRDGISLGEVGFPTLLYHNGFRFSQLNRSDYFTHEWND